MVQLSKFLQNVINFDWRQQVETTYLYEFNHVSELYNKIR